MDHYVAINSIHFTDTTDGKRKVAEAKGASNHGVFTGLDPAEAFRLTQMGAIRPATKTEIRDAQDDPAVHQVLLTSQENAAILDKQARERAGIFTPLAAPVAAAAPVATSSTASTAAANGEGASDNASNLLPKHVGGGKWIVQDGETVASGDVKFANKAEAEAWIAAQGAGGDQEESDLLG